MATNFVDILTRKISSDARTIKKELEEGKSVPYVIEWNCEPGEVLMTLLLNENQIQNGVKEALTRALFPTQSFITKDIGCREHLIWFTIEPSP